MTGEEFVTRAVNAPKYKKEFEENMYFRAQMVFLETKKEIHTSDLLDCIAYLSAKCFDKDLEMINREDQRLLTEEDII